MRVLGVDPGISITGFSILDTNFKSTKLVAYGTIRPKKKEMLPARLKHLFEEVSKIIIDFKPDALSIEDGFYSVNVKSAMVLGQARGAIIIAASINDISVSEYAPRKVKMSVCGSGSATKEQVSYMVSRILKLDSELKPYDISDSIAVGLCFINQGRFR